MMSAMCTQTIEVREGRKAPSSGSTEDIDRLREEFLSLAAHELKTPVTVLKLQVQIARRTAGRDAEAMPRQLTAMLDVLERQICRLTRLCDELLETSCIQAGQLPLALEDVDLAALVREVLGHAVEQQLLPGCAVELRADAAVVGRWDRAQLEQVVFHLVKNAGTFGAGKLVEVEVRESDRGAELMIRDHGIGVLEEDKERIFERFERAASAKHFGGLGLGLYLARAIVRAHGGSIRVESRPGEGATFIVDLPRAPCPAG